MFSLLKYLIAHSRLQLLKKQMPTDKSLIISSNLLLLSSFAWIFAYLYGTENNMHPFELGLTRGISLTFFGYFSLRYSNLSLDFKNTANLKRVIIRNALLAISSMVMVLGQQHLSIGIVHTLMSTCNIWVCLLQHFLKGKSINKYQAAGVLIAFIGVSLTANGEYLSQYFNKSPQSQISSSNSSEAFIAIVLLLLASISNAFGVFLTNEVDQDPQLIIFNLGVMSVIMNSFGLSFSPERVSAGVFYYSFLYSGLLFVVAQWTFTYALIMSSNISITSLLCYSVILIGYATSIIRYHQSINKICALGSLILVTGLGMILLLNDSHQVEKIHQKDSIQFIKCNQN